MDLQAWYARHGRHDLPWRQTRDPYRILVSELMLQQTQVPRVIPKYEEFVRRYPTIHALAAAPRADVLRAWQGLGYNSRAARLHALAQLIVEEHGGVLPATEEGLRALPGIGPYTAAAVMVFAHDAPCVPMDVNVRRVLTRIHYTCRQRPTDDDIRALARSAHPHDLFSALMDFGSSVCTATPKCGTCPLRAACKSKGARPDEAKRAQPRFQGSTRWWRGRILALLLRKGMRARALPRAIKEGATAEDAGACAAALAALEAEGLVRRERGLLKAA